MKIEAYQLWAYFRNLLTLGLTYWGHNGQVVRASTWESEGSGFEPQRLKAVFAPGLPKQSHDFARDTLKDERKEKRKVQLSFKKVSTWVMAHGAGDY